LETVGHENSESPCDKTGVNLSASAETSENRDSVQPTISSVANVEQITADLQTPNMPENNSVDEISQSRQADIGKVNEKRRQSLEKANRKNPKKREAYEREGGRKYFNRQIREIKADLRTIKRQLALVIAGMEHQFVYEKDLLESAIAKDDVDKHILDELAGASRDGLLPRDLARSIGLRSVTPKKVTSRINAMNRRMWFLFERNAAEKRGMQWAMTDWMRDGYGAKASEVH